MRRLALLAERSGGEVTLPTPSGVLYMGPNPDGSRKNCANCWKFMHRISRCMEHGPSVKDAPDNVCGYHVFGRPTDATEFPAGAMFVPPDLSGLVRVHGGTSCDNCPHFTAGAGTKGACRAVADPETLAPPAAVDALGCCSRWDGETAE